MVTLIAAATSSNRAQYIVAASIQDELKKDIIQVASRKPSKTPKATSVVDDVSISSRASPFLPRRFTGDIFCKFVYIHTYVSIQMHKVKGLK